jgi:hypothetical protein
LGLLSSAGAGSAQTAEDLTKQIERLVALDSIDLCKFDIKYRPSLEPPLDALDADESLMKVLKNPYAAPGNEKMGWYRVSFVVPEKLGKIALAPAGNLCGIESNVHGNWEIYTYVNGKPGGIGKGLVSMSNQPPTNWVSNAGMPIKAGDKCTIAILATTYPLGRGNPEGFALRHLRLRFAGGYTGDRMPFYSGLFIVRERLRTLKGDPLKTLQDRVQSPLARIEKNLVTASESANLSTMFKAMAQARKDLSDALNKK